MHDRSLAKRMQAHFRALIAVLLLSSLTCLRAESELTNPRKCYLRCIAKCIEEEKLIASECSTKCDSYTNDTLCADVSCWASCNDLAEKINIPEPTAIAFEYDEAAKLSLSWNASNATIFIVQYSTSDAFDSDDTSEMITKTSSLVNWTRENTPFCSAIFVRVASVQSAAVSEFSKTERIPPPTPHMDSTIELVNMKYFDHPYNISGYYSNATVRVTLRYAKSEWPLGHSDLAYTIFFSVIKCPKEVEFMPNPIFYDGEEQWTTYCDFGAEIVYYRCTLGFIPQTVESRQCGVKTDLAQVPRPLALTMNCMMVENMPCDLLNNTVHPGPLCGQVSNFSYIVLNDDVDGNDLNTNITIRTSFKSILRGPHRNPLYFISFYGNAEPYEGEDQGIVGVRLLDILGNGTDCPKFDNEGHCTEEINVNESSIVLTDLRMDNLYGVMVCAVLDAKNLTIPALVTAPRKNIIKADRVFIESQQYIKSKTGMIIGVVVSAVVLVIIIIIVFFIRLHRRQQKKLKMNQFKLEQLKLENEQRYTDFPRKHDLWELERRNLVIYDDKKLGSGAFGAVYKGRLIGLAKGHKDAQSTLGVNLMRAENCDVAVKMLPEYADEMSKSDFLKEIGLMKSLGYHERLVNMLACITDSEPYCLVVEYCSDGDLLHFLRERCKYMLKLSDMGIDYDNPTSDDEFDVEMIVTLKQLLMFAVQISYGLEYLSQKGFVHRDVAARNILVHEKTNAKIGDFGLCRYIYAETANYKGKGGRLPVKWMSPEAIKHYEFTTKSDVWSFGILMFEVITLGGSPYPGIQPDDVLEHLDAGGRMGRPDNCPENFYEVMKSCWATNPERRPEFGTIRQKLASQLEEVTDEYSYLKLDSQRDYYNVVYEENNEGGTSIDLNEEVVKEMSEDDFEDISLSPATEHPPGSPFLNCLPEGLENFLDEEKNTNSSLDHPTLNISSSTNVANGQINKGFVE